MSTKIVKELSPKCKDFLKKKESFRWFIEKYYGLKKFIDLWHLAEQNEEEQLVHELTQIWYELPDSIFNIQNNPKGWENFLSLVEN